MDVTQGCLSNGTITGTKKKSRPDNPSSLRNRIIKEEEQEKEKEKFPTH